MSLFDVQTLPEGFQYQPDFISGAEERGLAESVARLEFSTFEMRGVVARRRVAFFGESYNQAAAIAIPDFLEPLRSRVAAWAGVTPDDFAMALINEYTQGAPIGWHRDAPRYDIIAGVSLLSPCRMKLRPYLPPAELRGSSRRPARKTTHEITLARRSGYVIRGVARSDYEHSIPATKDLRYSITFRTLR